MKRLPLLLATCLLALSGCGGGGGAASGLNPTLLVHWGARSRDVTSPSSALSIDVVLSNGAEAVINRGDTVGAFDQTYSLPMSTAAGSYTATLTFYSQEDGAGGILATASGPAAISASSLSLGSYSTTGNIASVAILPSQTVPVGGTIIVYATAYDSSGNDLAVTPGSVFWTTASTDGSMTLSADGHVTATAAGTLSATVSIDGHTSAAQTITSYSAAANASCTNATYTPNYVAAMVSSTDATYHGVPRHWTSFPVTVAIVNNSYLTSAFSTAASQALSAWTAASAGQVTFTLVSASQNPDVTITFEPSTKISGSNDGVVGLTTAYPSATNNSVLTHADVQIATDLSSSAETVNCITHELGHSLGIGGHSGVEEDLMYPYLNDDEAPTSDDINTLLTAYCGSFPQASAATRAARPARSKTPIVIVDPRRK